MSDNDEEVERTLQHSRRVGGTLEHEAALKKPARGNGSEPPQASPPLEASDHEALSPEIEMIRQRVWTLEEMLADWVMLEDGALVTRLSSPHVALPFGTMHTLTARSFDMLEGADGKRRRVARVDQWNAAARLQAWSRTFAPGAQALCADPDGRRCVNLWRAIPHQASANWEERVAPFLDHLEYLIPQSDERSGFCDWLAHTEKRPGERPNVHYLLCTRTQGVGRNWLAEVLARVWRGQVATSVDLLGMLTGGFNGPIAGRLLGVVDELHADMSGFSMYRVAEALKTELTATRRTVNPKYGRQYTEHCATRWLMFSNHLAAIPLTQFDRRVAVIENPATAREAAYYTNLYRLLDQPEFVASVREWLRCRDLRAFNPGARATMNAAKAQVITATRSEVHETCVWVREHWPCDIILSSDLMTLTTDEQDNPPKGPALRAAALDAGLVPGGKQIKFGGHPHRFWIVRDPDKCAKATIAAIIKEAQRGRAQHGCKTDLEPVSRSVLGE